MVGKQRALLSGERRMKLKFKEESLGERVGSAQLLTRQPPGHRCCRAEYSWRQWHPTPVLLPGKSHGRRSLVGYSLWGRSESGTTERLRFHFSLSCIGEGDGNPLQYSYLENPRDGGAWWAAVSGVAQSQTRLKRLSSSSSSSSLTQRTSLVKLRWLPKNK